MGILLEIFKDGEKEISLTEYSIKNILFQSDAEVTLGHKFNDITRDVIISGAINIDKIDEKPRVMVDDFGNPMIDDNGNEKQELREIDSVRKLANWAIVPEYCECYRDLTVTLTNARGDLVKTESYEDLYVVEYKESFSDEMGHGNFYVMMREREIRLQSE